MHTAGDSTLSEQHTKSSSACRRTSSSHEPYVAVGSSSYYVCDLSLPLLLANNLSAKRLSAAAVKDEPGLHQLPGMLDEVLASPSLSLSWHLGLC
jgi:hypothetical protein